MPGSNSVGWYVTWVRSENRRVGDVRTGTPVARPSRAAPLADANNPWSYQKTRMSACAARSRATSSSRPGGSFTMVTAAPEPPVCAIESRRWFVYSATPHLDPRLGTQTVTASA
jgi:hypothetical protein